MRLALIALALLAAPAAAAAQPPARDTPRPAVQTGTATIRGRVVAADGGRPLRRVQLRLAAPELGAPQGRTTSTDEDGRYEVSGLPAGRYTVTARRGGFLPLQYGQRRPSEQGKPVQVANGQLVEQVDFALPKASAISGRVVDETGDPIAGATVLAWRSMYLAGRRQVVPSGDIAQTDEDGEFRITGLMPGTYTVSARSDDVWAVDAGGVSQSMAYAPTYFPGTTTAGDARKIVLGIGQEQSGTDFAVIPGRAVTISGTAFDSRGRPMPSVALRLEIRAESGGSFRSAGSSPVSPDGAFTIRDVVPGDYILTATSPEPFREVAAMPVTVEGADIQNISLAASSGGTITGRVVVEPGSAVKVPRVQFSVVERVVGASPPASQGGFQTAGRGDADADGTFVLKNVFGPGPFAVTLPDGWALTSITHGGRDVTDAPVDLRRGGEMGDVVVTITDRLTVLSGDLTTDRGTPTVDGTVIVFAADASKWFDDSRFVGAVRPDQGGRFQIKGLPPGDYLAVAVDSVEQGDWYDAAFLGSLRDRAQAVTLVRDTPRTLSLKLIAR